MFLFVHNNVLYFEVKSVKSKKFEIDTGQKLVRSTLCDVILPIELKARMKQQLDFAHIVKLVLNLTVSNCKSAFYQIMLFVIIHKSVW